MIAWVVDSSTELTEGLRAREDLFVVQDYVNFPDGRSFRDNELGGIDNLIAMMEPGLKEGKLPKTNNPPPIDFKRAFEEIMERGYSHVIGLFLPPRQSGTWNSAMSAREYVPALEYFFPETRNFSIATTPVLERAMESGLSYEAVQDLIIRADRAAAAYLTVSDLGYAHAGGRIGRAASMFGTLLNIKPIIVLDEHGILTPYEKVRTMGKAAARMAELITRDIGDRRKIIGYAGQQNEQHAYALRDLVENAYVIQATSGALVANSGPFIAVAGLPF